jgi:putative PEP-CTERM system TPR-repeat lipoprotein
MTVSRSLFPGSMCGGGDFEKAETVLVGRLKIDPKNQAVGSALALLYLESGRPEEAKNLYSDLLSRKPNDLATLIGLADIATAEMKWEEARSYIARARTVAPDDPVPGLRLVKLDASRRDWKNALATAAELTAKFPTNLEVLDAKGQAQIATGDTVGAVATYKRVYELAPDSLLAMSRYLAVLDQAENFPEARAVLRAALDREPKNASLKGDLIRVEAEIGGLEAGLAAARSFSESDPDNSLYDMVSAELYEKAGRSGEAVGLLEKSVAARPSDSRLATALSSLYARTGTPDKAEGVLKPRLQADPKDTVVRSALASLFLDQKRYAAAIAEYSRLVEDQPADQSALNDLAWLYQQQGDLTRARDLAERAFSIAPRSAQIDDTLGWILVA